MDHTKECQIIAIHATGKTPKEIAKDAGVTQEEVEQCLARHGKAPNEPVKEPKPKKKKVLTDEVKKKINEMYAEGVELREMARRLKINYGTLYYYVNKELKDKPKAKPQTMMQAVEGIKPADSKVTAEPAKVAENVAEPTREEIIEAAKICLKYSGCLDCPLSAYPDYDCDAAMRRYIIATEKEPASAGTPTSSKTKYPITDDTTNPMDCQALSDLACKYYDMSDRYSDIANHLTQAAKLMREAQSNG